MIRDMENIEDDIIYKKRMIAKMIYEDADIIELLDNPNIDPDCPDEALYNNIFSFIRVPSTQDVSKVFITFMLDNMEIAPINPSMKKQYLKVVIFVHKDLVKTKYGADRHDLIAYCIRDIFHYTNKLGLQFSLISDREGAVDVDYATRTLQFEATTPNYVSPTRTNPRERNNILGHQGFPIDD